MKPSSRDGGSDLFPVVALAADALARPLAALGHPLGEEGRPALRARLGHRPGPRRELAVGIPVARVEGLAAPAPPFHELASAARLGTGDAKSDGLGRLALRIARASDELAEATVLDDHGLAACRTRLVRHLVGRLLTAAQVLGVLAVGIARAREELAETPPLLQHGLATLGAGLACLLPDLVVGHAALRLADVAVELLVELADEVEPVGIPFLDLVERLL